MEVSAAMVKQLREKTGVEVARRYGIPARYTTAAEMLQHERLDALVASHLFTRHGIILQELLGCGKPVFIEKPLAASVQTGERILELVKKSATFVMVGYHKRSDPATMYAKGIIEELTASGEIGKPTYVRISMPAGDWVNCGFEGLIDHGDRIADLESDPPDPDLTEEENARYIGFVNYYIHQVNLLRHLLGEPYEPVFTDQAGMLLVGRSRSGRTGVIEMSPYTTSVDWQEEALVCFQRGWIRLSLPAPLASNRAGKVETYRDPGGGKTPIRESPTLPWVHAMKQQAANFIAAVRGERPPMTGAEEALEDLRIARRYLELAEAQKPTA